MAHSYTTVRLSKWQEYKWYVQQFSDHWGFRGQASADWVLNNAIERTDFVQHYSGVESEFVSEFQRGARNYLSRDETPGHLIEWLALMQHHGAPTRLLDLSKSPFIAAYFAYELCLPCEGSYAAVWGINVHYLKNRALEVLSRTYEEELSGNRNLINESLFERIFYENNQPLVFPVEPFRMNRRYSLQQSLFLSTGVAAQPFMEQLNFLGDDLDKAVVKIELPAAHKKEALRDLQQMNLHRASLFPDLDGYAASLRLRYESRLTPEESDELHLRKLDDEQYPFFP